MSSSGSNLGPRVKADDIIACKGCGCYSMQSEMEFPEEHGCSSACRERIRAKNREQAKRDRDLLVQRQRREMRKKERVRIWKTAFSVRGSHSRIA